MIARRVQPSLGHDDGRLDDQTHTLRTTQRACALPDASPWSLGTPSRPLPPAGIGPVSRSTVGRRHDAE